MERDKASNKHTNCLLSNDNIKGDKTDPNVNPNYVCTQSSSRIDTISEHVENEMKRLKAHVALFWEKEVRCYTDFGLKDGMSLVEYGSGPGYLTEKLLETFPHLHVTAVETDSDLIEKGKKSFE